MARGSKKRKTRAFLSRLFTGRRVQLEIEPRFTPDGVGGSAGSIFTNGHNFVVHGLAVNYNVQGEKERIAQVMSLLARHIIHGAAHDSSARVPPPRCHPGTRIKLNERITIWFYDKGRQKVLLWVNGPAGVGKSAVVRTFAESIAASGRLGASVFFSRPNKRNDPHRVFVTIAYQLAVRIEAYRTFIAEELAPDPDLLNKEMEEQFRIFIVEPFVEKKIGAGGDAWGVLLDGLDEVEGQDLQCEIIRLISTFFFEHPEAPLVWVISSRPEPHISDTFDEEERLPSYWQEYIPVDSTEACEDVERFLRVSFETIRKRFPRSAPKKWPTEGTFLKLAGGSSGLFVFADVAIRFIRDVNFASPVSRLEPVLSAIEGSKFYPPALWLTAKQLFGFALWFRIYGALVFQSPSLMGMSVILNIKQDVIYASLNKCYSILEIPPPKQAYSKSVTFFHTSFADYLTDFARSKDFYICLTDAMDDVTCCLFHIMQDFVSKESPKRSQTLPAWIRYCSQYHGKAPGQRSKKIPKTLALSLFHASCDGLYRTVTRKPVVLQRDLFEILHLLDRLDIADLDLNFLFVDWLFEVWRVYPEELLNRGLAREISLKELKFQHLDCKWTCPMRRENHQEIRPRLSTQLLAFVSELESPQRQNPDREVLIFGSKPEIRNALLYDGFESKTRYFIPYPY